MTVGYLLLGIGGAFAAATRLAIDLRYPVDVVVDWQRGAVCAALPVAVFVVAALPAVGCSVAQGMVDAGGIFVLVSGVPGACLAAASAAAAGAALTATIRLQTSAATIVAAWEATTRRV
jgi:hypothetical protein